MRKSWIIEKVTDGYESWYQSMPIEGGGRSDFVAKPFLLNRVPYFVVYEGRYVPDSLCQCRSDRIRWGLTRLVHVYSWGDVPWIELIAWGF